MGIYYSGKLRYCNQKSSLFFFTKYYKLCIISNRMYKIASKAILLDSIEIISTNYIKQKINASRHFLLDKRICDK